MTGLRLVVEQLRIRVGEVVLEVPAFHAETGQACLVTGASGGGKTVFLRVLLGLASPESVEQGCFTLTLDGRSQRLDYPGYRAAQWLRQRTAAVFQDAFHSLHPYRSIEHQCPATVAQFRAFKLDPDRFLSRRRRRVLDDPQADHSGPEPRYVRDCSGGECQRISLLFPFVGATRQLVVLDEPLTDIDMISKGSVRKVIDPLLGAPDKAVIVVSHETDWLPANAMRHYALTDPDAQGPRRLQFLGVGPPPASVPVAAADPAAHRGPAASAAPMFRLHLRRGHRLGGDNGFRLWPGVGLEVPPRGALGLIGESGSGKSTLLRAAAGLFPRRDYRHSVQAELCLDGECWTPIMQLNRRQRYGRIQYVSQDSSGSLIAREPVGSHLAWISKRKGVPKERFDALVQRFGRALGLFTDAVDEADFKRRRHGVLSMGQKRRYGLLRAILLLDIYDPRQAAQPKLLLLDEVSRGLDGDNLARLLAAVEQLRAECNLAVIAVSHDLRFVRQLCDDIRMVYRGAVLPSSIRPADLAVRMADGSVTNAPLNPYYRWFLREEEVPNTLLVPPEERNRIALDDYSGCLLRRSIRCPAERRPGCCHAELAASTNQPMVGICC